MTRPDAALTARVADAVSWLERRGTSKNLAAMARYGIVAPRAFGVSVGDTKAFAKRLGRDHQLALALWETGWYEARLLAGFVDIPEDVTVRQMTSWAADFDNWGVVDTVCFHLFDRSPHAWPMARRWATAKPEFTRRAAFALMWSLTVHDRTAPDRSFLACLPLIERGAQDPRHFVSKAVNMSLRAIGKRNAVLHAAALDLARQLAAESAEAPRWVGKHALRELDSVAVRRRVAARAGR